MRKFHHFCGIICKAVQPSVTTSPFSFLLSFSVKNLFRVSNIYGIIEMAGLIVVATLILADKVNDIRKERKRAKRARRDVFEYMEPPTSQRGRGPTSNANDRTAPSYTPEEAPPRYEDLYGSRSSSEERRGREANQNSGANS